MIKHVRIKDFRERNTQQIIDDNYSSGCTDTALVFITLCRAKGIPTKYVETLKKRWLEDPNAKKIEGHVFAECYIRGKWYQIDPEMGTIYTRKN